MGLQHLANSSSLNQSAAIVLTNSGLEDANGLTVFTEALDDSGIVHLDEQAVDVLSGQTVRQILDLGQMKGGAWTLHAWLEVQDGTILAEVQEYIPPIDQGDSRDEVQMLVTTGRGWWLAAFLILAVTSVLVMITMRFLSASTVVNRPID